MFTLRERIEIALVILAVVFGTPMAMVFGSWQAHKDADILFPKELPAEVQRAIQQSQQQSQQSLENP